MEAYIDIIAAGRTYRRIPDGTSSLLHLIREIDAVELDSPCGGNGTCGKCLVRVLTGSASSPDAEEQALLGEDAVAAGMRLACRLVPSKQASLVVEPVPLAGHARIQVGFEPAGGGVAAGGTPVHLGCAVDIGTTTVVVYLVDLSNKTVLGERAALNRQRRYGADVISRIQHCRQYPLAIAELQQAIVGQLDAMIKDLCESHGVAPQRLERVVAVGNPTMIHLLVKADPSGIACAPFTCAFTAALESTGAAIGLTCAAQAPLILPGAVAAYVGSDITAGLATTDIFASPEPALYVDIGTNGEIALWDGKRLLCCSSAAGPAFEGASIKHGTGAVDGAVDHVWLKTDPDGTLSLGFSTIGSTEPVGICGSGIIDIMAALLDAGVVDESGAMEGRHPLVRRGPDGWEIAISDKLAFTNRDVREVQLAKAAIAAGIDTLLKTADLSLEDLGRIIIAGGFGSFIALSSALKIGLLPAIGKKPIKAVGNAAGKGACMAACDETVLRRIETLRQNAIYVELSASALFQERYIEHMLFGRES